MRRRTFILGMAGLAGCTRDTRPRLNVFNWSEYIAPETLQAFEEAAGCRVHYALFESNEELLAKVFSGNSGWDVVFPSHYFLQPMRENGLLLQLDHRRLPRLSNLSDDMRNPPWDPDLAWGLPYMEGAAGIACQQSVATEAESWDLLWDPQLRGKVTMLDDPADSIGVALMRLGYPLNSEDPAQLREARNSLIAQKQVLRAYLNSEARQQLVAGDLQAAHMWSTTAMIAMDETSALQFTYPREGFARYADCAVVLKESRRAELAHEFLDFLLDPSTAAANAVAAFTRPAVGAARDLLPAALQENPALFPEAAARARGQWFAPLSPEGQRIRDRIWTEVKAA
jgi:spermidine/putrescine transport system substrate-binding protein